MENARESTASPVPASSHDQESPPCTDDSSMNNIDCTTLNQITTTDAVTHDPSTQAHQKIAQLPHTTSVSINTAYTDTASDSKSEGSLYSSTANTSVHSDGAAHQCTEDVEDNKQYHCKINNSSNGAHFPHPDILACPANGSSITLTFHVIVPVDLWGWDERSCVHLCFDHEKLGGLKACHGIFTKREPSCSDRNMYEMTCSLQMDKEILKDPLTYKYAVFSPKVVKKDADFSNEHLRCCYSKKHGQKNRCLVIGDYIGDSYVQYDTIVYPCDALIEKEPFYTKWLEKMIIFLDKVQDHLPAQKERALAMKMYLYPYDDVICRGGYLCNNSLMEMAEKIKYIYSQLSKVHIIDKGHHIQYCDINISEEMKNNIQSWLEKLNQMFLESPDIRCYSSVAVIYISTVLELKLSITAATLAMGMVQLKPNVANKTCEQFELLKKLIPDNVRRKNVGNSVLQMCSELMINGKMEWLNALPLAHLLCEDCVPFAEIPNPRDLQWSGKVFKPESAIKRDWDAIQEFEKNSDVFKLDPLLLPIFIHSCPKNDLENIFQHIPLSVSIAYISYLVLTEEWKKIDEYSSLLCVILKVMDTDTSGGDRTVLEASLLLLSKVMEKIKSTQRGHSVKLLRILIPPVLLALCNHDITCEDKKQTFDQLALLLDCWITSKDVMGCEESFNGKNNTFLCSWRGKNELEIWHEVFSIGCSKDKSISDDWHKLLCEPIKKRLHQVSSKVKLQLVGDLEDMSNVPTQLMNIVQKEAEEAIDDICSKSERDANKEICILVKRDSERVGKLIGRILLKRYPDASNSSFEVTFDDLMEWDLWPCFIRASYGMTKIKDGLNKQCIPVCNAAVKRLECVCGQLASGDILVDNLKRIKEKECHLVELCEAHAHKVHVCEVQKDLEQRMQELNVYTSHRECLSHFISNARLPEQTPGLPGLNNELQMNISCETISNLCNMDKAVRQLCDIAVKFNNMTKEHISGCHSIAFFNIWKYHLEAINSNFSVHHIDDYVFQPSHKLTSSLISTCRDMTIALGDVDKWFKPLESEGILENELSNLSKCLEAECTIDWIHNTCARMREYWILCTKSCKEGAVAVLKLKDAIPLKGDFKNLDMLCTGIVEAMKNDPLKMITNTLVETGQFLIGIGTDGKEQKCFETFHKCLPLSKWLQKETKGVNDLNRFITIALSTATGGEDALTQDKLSNLKTVGSCYAPLIYLLQTNGGFNELLTCWKHVWKSFLMNPSVSAILDGCLEHLDWYKHIKQNIGSVEESSFKQLDNIQAYGEYSVGIVENDPHCSQLCIQDIMQLYLLNTDDESVVKTQYSLEELRDLESRLILVTSCKARNTNHVELFKHTLHSICRICEVLIDFQREGSASSDGWKLTCSCQTDCIEELNEQAIEMEKDLQCWKQELQNARETYYELNYYTNVQLLVLRKEFACEQIKLTPHLLALLQSISPYVTVQEIQQHISVWKLKRINSDGTTMYMSMAAKSDSNVKITVNDTCYLTLQDIGRILQSLRWKGSDMVKHRPFPDTLTPGKPCLITTDSTNVLKTVLSIYMESPSSPLPTLEEVLLCNEQTSEEEAQLLFRRAVGDPGSKRIFCLVHAEKLSFRIAENVLRLLEEIKQKQLRQKEPGYRLVIICCTDQTSDSYVATKLQMFHQHFNTSNADDLSMFLSNKLDLTQHKKQSHQKSTASSELEARPCVRIVFSTRCGMGKSLQVQRIAETIADCTIVCIPLHGPGVTTDSIIMKLPENHVESSCTILHFDIAPNVLHQVDCILFSLLILKGLSSSFGKIWRCNPNDIYVVEVTIPEQKAVAVNTVSFLTLLPSVKCLSPLELRMKQCTPEFVGYDHKTFCSEEYQRVYQTLKTSSSAMKCELELDMMDVFMHHCRLKDPSWSELNYFIQFLAVQLRVCKDSIFCNEDIKDNPIAGMKDFVKNFMIEMSTEFSIPSLCSEPAQQKYKQKQEAVEEAKNDIDKFQIEEVKKWDKSSHPYLFFNKDEQTFTFVGFNVTPEGDLVASRHRDFELQNSMSGQEGRISAIASSSSTPYLIKKSIMTPALYRGLQNNRIRFDEDYQNLTKDQMIRKLSYVMGLEPNCNDPDPSYVLTADNLIKILAILMRFRCGIPVVLMGETGCGKTRLVQYMCNLAAQCTGAKNIKILKVHGGTTEKKIIKFVNLAEESARENMKLGLDTVVFFDELNTTEAVGLIKELMCDRRMNGKLISHELKFIAACNPYQRHSYEMIKKLESAGLGFYIKINETQERLGKTPLRHLVYRVLELPPSMRSLVYDFGQLDTKTESEYVAQIVKCHLGKQLAQNELSAIAHVLSWSQQYMKNQKDECSYISLRDVKRAVIVFDYFMNKWPSKKWKDHSLILTLAVCYDARLQNKDDYEEKVCKEFRSPFVTPDGAKHFRAVVRSSQEDLLESMEVGPNIAHNAALRENVFMMVICIELRIPLFVIGKPGSSKSLAKSIVTSSMMGAGSSNDWIKRLKEVYMVSYQCSQHSTPKSIKDVFKTAQKFQKKQESSQFVSLVVLEEVGLAEDSPHLPLKALHPLLEDGTFTQDDLHVDQRVAFIGISNWALDPAKMNRGLMLTRGEPSNEELIDSAHGICLGIKDDTVVKQLEQLFEPLAKAFKVISKTEIKGDDGVQKELYGLRDFYSLIKMLCCICKQNNRMPTWHELRYAIAKNFGGQEDFDPTEEFRRRIDNSMLEKDTSNINVPDTSLLGIIRSSLECKDTSSNSDNRYLLFLTENYAALQILLDRIMSHTTSENTVEPYVLFGSSFPKDREYTQICQNVNQVKLCMETGRTVILLNLEHLYESLYDALNQYYIKYGEKRYVDLGLQAHKVKCMVHENFRLVLIAEKKVVYEKFPIPLISRLEKHFVVTSSIFSDWQKDVLHRLITWTEKFSVHVHDNCPRRSNFKVEEVFIGWQKDTTAAVIFQATKHCHEVKECRSDQLVSLMLKVFGSISIDDIRDAKEGSEYWKSAVLLESQHLLLRTASPDAIIRLNKSFAIDYKEIQSKYFSHLHCPSLLHYISQQIDNCDSLNGLMMQVTTHSRVMPNGELIKIASSLKVQVRTEIVFLHEFDMEIDFTKKVRSVFQRQPEEENEENAVLLIIQCQLGHLYGDLIACARYRISDERIKALQNTKLGVQHAFMPHRSSGCTHVLFIIYLPRQTPSLSFVGFQGDPWSSAHIDELRSTNEEIMSTDAFECPISTLFYSPSENGSMIISNNAFRHTYSYHKRMHSCIQAAVAMLPSSSQTCARRTKLVHTLLNFIPNDPPKDLDAMSFYKALVKHVHSLLQQMEKMHPESTKWVLNEALSHQSLQQGGTLRNTLIRKIDGMIVPILAHIISFIDQYSNLALYSDGNKVSNLCKVSNLWLQIFSDLSIVQLKYCDIMKPNIYLSEIDTAQFECKFPFFWMIKEMIDASIRVVGYDTLPAVIEKVLTFPIARILTNYEELFERYLHDFVACTYTSLQKKPDDQVGECKLASDALSGLVCKNVANGSSLVEKLTALHTAYLANKSYLLWFGNLVSCIPDILSNLTKKASREKLASPEQLAMHAVEAAFDHLKSHLLHKNKISAQNWLLLVQQSQVTIETLLKLHPTNDIIRHDWHCIKAAQIFFEHIGSKYEKMRCFAQEIYGVCSSHNSVRTAMHTMNSNLDVFGSPQIATIHKIEGILNKLNESHSSDSETRCHASFIELVSRLCFGYEPPTDTIKQLLDMTKPLDAKAEVIRSSLLQLLLKHSLELVHEYVQKYLWQYESVDYNHIQLHVLIIKCLQDALHTKHGHKTPQKQARVAGNLLEKAFQCPIIYSGKVTLEYLEAVAQIRYGLLIAVDVLPECIDDPINATFFTALTKICSDEPCIAVQLGPKFFFLQMLARSYSMRVLKMIAKRYPWILPQLLISESESQPDLFVAYGDIYCDVRDCVQNEMLRNQKCLEDKYKHLKEQEQVFINLALYKVVSVCWEQSHYIPSPEVFTTLENCSLSDTLHTMAKTILMSKQDSFLVKLSAQHGLLAGIIVHTAAVMFSREGVPLLWPFVTMLCNPASLMNAYLPTMPDKILPNVTATLKSQVIDQDGRFHECLNGHFYFVRDHEWPAVKEKRCPECGATMKNQSDVHSYDVQKLGVCGYILPDPEQRSSNHLQERSLSPEACCLVRILMHSSFIWSCCAPKGALNDVNQLLRKKDLSAAFQLLLEQLEKDLEILQKAIKKSELECALLVHAVLQGFGTVQCTESSSSNQLKTANQRSEWEKTFSDVFICPVLKNFEDNISNMVQSIMNHSTEEYGRFVKIIHGHTSEKIAVKDLTTHVWAYHPNFSLESIQISLESQSLQSKCHILYDFLLNEHALRATQCIPDIFKLMNLLHSHYNYHLHHKEASTATIGTFIEQPKVCSSQDVNIMLKSLNKAWGLCRELLKNNSRIPIEDRYLIQSFTPDVTLEHIIPTTIGAGVCTTALLDFLVRTHNGFLEKCNITTEKENKKLILQKMPIQQIQRFHTLNYEKQLGSVISSHCLYSLTTGRDVQYDVVGLQKQLVNQFINGKPTIILDVPQVVYRTDIHSVKHFTKIKERLYPQVKLPHQTQKEILNEIAGIPLQKETLESLEKVTALLISGGAIDIHMNLASYAESLKIKFSSKIQKCCKLSHVLSLWMIVSVEIARQLVFRNQEPFDEMNLHNELTVAQRQKLESIYFHSGSDQSKLDELVVWLYSFISIHIRNSKPIEEKARIVDGMKLFYNIYDDGDDIIAEHAAQFPDDITIGQAVDAWKHLVKFQNRIKGHNLT